MTIGEFCNREVFTCHPAETVLDAARRMRDHHVGCLIVVAAAGGRSIPVGMVTDRDIVVFAVATGAPDPGARHVGDIMSRSVTTARESEDLLDTLKLMRGRGVRRLPVVDEDGALVGLATFDDMLEHVAGEVAELSALVERELRRERDALMPTA